MIGTLTDRKPSGHKNNNGDNRRKDVNVAATNQGHGKIVLSGRCIGPIKIGRELMKLGTSNTDWTHHAM